MFQSEKMTHLQQIVAGEAKSLNRGYGCNGLMYNLALQCLDKDFGSPTIIVTSFFDDWTTSAARLYGTTETKKISLTFCRHLPNAWIPPRSLLYNAYSNLQQNLRQSSRIDLSIWFNVYAEACSDLPSSNQQAFSSSRPTMMSSLCQWLTSKTSAYTSLSQLRSVF